MGILHKKEFHNLKCSTIIIVRAIEGNVRNLTGRDHIGYWRNGGIILKGSATL
jgi:hypothetical protein